MYRKYSTPKMKYNQQKAQAMYRDEQWDITFEDWLAAWDESGQWENRGRKPGQCKMYRVDIAKGWTKDNVEISGHKGAIKDQPGQVPVIARKPINFGAGHDNKKKPIVAEGVRYESIAEAARQLDVNRGAIWFRLQGNDDYYFVGDE